MLLEGLGKGLLFLLSSSFSCLKFLLTRPLLSHLLTVTSHLCLSAPPPYPFLLTYVAPSLRTCLGFLLLELKPHNTDTC